MSTKMINIKLVETDSLFLESVANRITGKFGDWYYMPFWFKKIGDGLYEEYKFEDLPDGFKKQLTKNLP